MAAKPVMAGGEHERVKAVLPDHACHRRGHDGKSERRDGSGAFDFLVLLKKADWRVFPDDDIFGNDHLFNLLL